MRAVRRTLVSAGAVAALVLVPASGALAQQACDDYSGGCTEVGTPVKGSAEQKAVTPGNTPDSLPFTGAEITLLAAAGAGAVAVGAVAVRSGRRRTQPTA